MKNNNTFKDYEILTEAKAKIDQLQEKLRVLPAEEKKNFLIK